MTVGREYSRIYHAPRPRPHKILWTLTTNVMAEIEATAEDGGGNTKDLHFDSAETDGFIDIRIDSDKEMDDTPLDLSPDEHDDEPQEEVQEVQELAVEFDSSEHQLIGEGILTEKQRTDAERELLSAVAAPADTESPQENEPVEGEDEDSTEMKPLILPYEEVAVDDAINLSQTAASQEETVPVKSLMRSRKKPGSGSIKTTEYEDDIEDNTFKRSCLRRNVCVVKEEYHPLQTNEESSSSSGGAAAAMGCGRVRRFCNKTSQHYLVRTTVSVMNLLARILLWASFLSMVVAVVWYSRELKMNGTDPHLIAWFSAGAFVLLGFPISMCGIFMHLTNYYQPNVQCYVVRILWMVPIYSIESWLWWVLYFAISFIPFCGVSY